MVERWLFEYGDDVAMENKVNLKLHSTVLCTCAASGRYPAEGHLRTVPESHGCRRSFRRWGSSLTKCRLILTSMFYITRQLHLSCVTSATHLAEPHRLLQPPTMLRENSDTSIFISSTTPDLVTPSVLKVCCGLALLLAHHSGRQQSDTRSSSHPSIHTITITSNSSDTLRSPPSPARLLEALGRVRSAVPEARLD